MLQSYVIFMCFTSMHVDGKLESRHASFLLLNIMFMSTNKLCVWKKT